MIVPAHSVESLPSGLSSMQERLIESPAPVRLVSAPTGSGKSHAFVKAVLDDGAHVLFIAPTKRLIQNLMDGARASAREILLGKGLSDSSADSWLDERLLEWSGNQAADDGKTFAETRARQALDASAPLEGRMVFTIPEVVVGLISGVRAPGASRINPFFFVNRFDHVVFDEFHTIDDRAFGLACLLARCAVAERQARISLLSATPIDVAPIFERFGVERRDVETVRESVTAGLPPGHRPIHGDVALRIDDCPLWESVRREAGNLREAMRGGRQVIAIYDSLERLKKEELHIHAVLRDSGLESARILPINSIDDSRRKPGEPARGRRYADPRGFDMLLCTSSVEIGVNFRSVLMFMEPGHDAASFMQRVGRVARGSDNGQIIVAASQDRRNRHAWVRRALRTIEEHDTIDAESFVGEILRDEKRRLEPSPTEIEADPEAAEGRFFRRPSWRGVYWAALFTVAVRRKMKVQKGARNRLGDISPPIVKFVESRIAGILSVDKVDDCRREGDQPHKRWVEALLKSALAYRDIGAKIVVVDPDGSETPVSESFLRRSTDILRTHVVHDRDGEWTVELKRRPLDAEIDRFSERPPAVRLNLHIPSPLGGRGFDLSIRETEKGSEQLYRRLVEEWRERFQSTAGERMRGLDRDRAIVMDAATDLVRVLGKPPLSEDYEDDRESTVIA